MMPGSLRLKGLLTHGALVAAAVVLVLLGQVRLGVRELAVIDCLGGGGAEVHRLQQLGRPIPRNLVAGYHRGPLRHPP